jgi:hypothetical protein
MRSLPLRIVTGAALAGALALSPLAYADPTAADVLLARQLGNEGIELANKGECEPAIVKLQRAETLHHAPTLLVKIGECQVKLGKLVDALSTLDRAAREQLGPTPPKAFVAAQQRAQTLVQEIRPKLGTLRIDASGSRQGVSFRLDGDELKEAAIGLERPIDPGSHVVEATTADGKRFRREVTVKQGAGETVVLELPAQAPAAPAQAAVVGPAPEDRAPDKSRTMLGWGLTGGGAAALVAGVAFAGVTLSKKSDLDATCTDKACPAASRSDYDSARTTATISGIALGVGVVALAAGVFVLVTRSKGPERSARAAALLEGGALSF